MTSTLFDESVPLIITLDTFVIVILGMKAARQTLEINEIFVYYSYHERIRGNSHLGYFIFTKIFTTIFPSI